MVISPHKSCIICPFFFPLIWHFVYHRIVPICAQLHIYSTFVHSCVSKPAETLSTVNLLNLRHFCSLLKTFCHTGISKIPEQSFSKMISNVDEQENSSLAEPKMKAEMCYCQNPSGGISAHFFCLFKSTAKIH